MGAVVPAQPSPLGPKSGHLPSCSIGRGGRLCPTVRLRPEP
ncbi:MAG: hypothetical protein ACK55Z_24755 [bacterium]